MTTILGNCIGDGRSGPAPAIVYLLGFTAAASCASVGLSRLTPIAWFSMALTSTSSLWLSFFVVIFSCAATKF